MTALHLHDERYRVKTPVNSKIGDTLIDYLIKNDIASVSAEAPSDALGESQIDLYSPEVKSDVSSLACIFFLIRSISFFTSS